MAILTRCRELCLAGNYALALTGASAAADLTFKTPIVAPEPAFSWTDLYLGVGGGVVWGDNAYIWNQDATLAAIVAQTQNAGPQPLLGATQGSLPTSGEFFGGQVGGNWQVERAMLGIQADAHWADMEFHGNCFDPGSVASVGVNFDCNDKVLSFGTITPRVGAALDRMLIYAKGGWAWEDSQHEAHPTVRFNSVGGSQPSITTTSSRQSRTGGTFGTGVEYMFTRQWSAVVEYNHVGFGARGDENSTHLLSLPNNVPAGLLIPVQATATEWFNIVKVGLNYRFD